MAVKVKEIGKASEKFVTRASAATTDYQDGVRDTSPDQYASAAVAAGAAYAQGVQAAIGQKRFEKGIAAKKAKWQRKALDVGGARFGPGVAAAKADYESAVAPYLDTIKGLTLPPRGPAGTPANIERVRAIADALRKRKVGA